MHVNWPLHRTLKLTFRVLALPQNEWFFVFRIKIIAEVNIVSYTSRN